MTKNIVQRIVAIVLVAIAVVMAIVGGIHLPQRGGVSAQNAVREMRIRALLDVTGAGLVDTYVDIARQEAMAAGKAAGLSLKERKAAAEIAMEEARKQYENQEIDYSTLDTAALEPVVDAYAEKLAAYYTLRAEAQETYVKDNMAIAQKKADAERQKMIDEGKDPGEEKPVTVDVSNFDKIIAALHAINPDDLPKAAEATDALYAAQGEMDAAFAALREVIKTPCADITDADVDGLRAEIDKALTAGKAVHIAYHANLTADATGVDEFDPILIALNVYVEKQTALNTAAYEANLAAKPARDAEAAHEAAEKAEKAEADALVQSQEAFAAYITATNAYNEAVETNAENVADALIAAQDAYNTYNEKQAAYDACVAATAEAKAAVVTADKAAKNAEDDIKVKQEIQADAQKAADAAYEALTQAIIADFAHVDVESLTALRKTINSAVNTSKVGYITYKPVVAQTANPVLAETGYDALIADYSDKLAVYKAAEADAKAVYTATKIDALLKLRPEVQPELLSLADDIVLANEVTAALVVADEYFVPVGEELKVIYPILDDAALKTLKPAISSVVLQQGEGYTQLYDRYTESGSSEALTNPVNAWLIRYADDLLYGAAALIVLALIVLFYETLSKKLGIPRIVLGVFFILLCFMCLWFDLSLASLLSNSLVRMGMNAVMVLAMVPGIQCGISLNLGLPIGLVAGLIGGLCTIEWGIPGVWGFIVAILVGCIIAAVAGWLYAHLLNRLKGEEMSVTTYVGFSIVSLMCIAWLVLPFQSLKLRWPMGTGLRNTIGLDSTNFKHVLDDFLAFQIGDFVVPTGLLLFMALMCFLVWLFTRSKTGVAMAAVGNNPRFAEATGINVDKMRVIGTVLSTVLGAIGILVYSQSYGFMQLYTAPRQMGFIAASAILIGGASTSRCKISHVVIGTFLFQGVLTLGMPVANVLVPGSTISETLRILISNGIILYALTKSGGESRA